MYSAHLKGGKDWSKSENGHYEHIPSILQQQLNNPDLHGSYIKADFLRLEQKLP